MHELILIQKGAAPIVRRSRPLYCEKKRNKTRKRYILGIESESIGHIDAGLERVKFMSMERRM